MAKKKQHPQGVEQFADSTNALADAPKQYQDITLDGQLSLFDAPRLRITKPLRLIELFSGIGAQAKALQRLGVPYESWGAYDIDRYAVAAYNAIHGTDYVPTDITKMTADDLNIVDTEHYTYLLTYSFPCQDLSLAGKGQGMTKGSGTRSGLLWEVERLLNECKELPQILVMENVKQILSKNNEHDFSLWRKALSLLGYTSSFRIMNAKEYGIPQNRPRCFMVSWLGPYEYEFPERIKHARRLCDIVEQEVEDKYYVKESTLRTFVKRSEEHKKKGNGFRFEPIDISANSESAAHTIRDHYRNQEDNFFYDGAACSKAVLAKQRDWLTGSYWKDMAGKIRKPTPLECWRLMDFDDEDFYKARAIESNTQLYAQAGNSIVVNCLVAIFGQMFDGKENVYAERFGEPTP